jgi:hypothetical protein
MEDSFRRGFLRGGTRMTKSNRRDNALAILVRLSVARIATPAYSSILEKIVDLDVGVTVVAIMHLSAFAKERIRFVEKEDRTTLPRRIEDASQILLRLANIFRDDGAQIDTVQFFSQIAGQSVGGDERAHQSPCSPANIVPAAKTPAATNAMSLVMVAT